MAILSGVFEPENSEQMQILHQAEMSSHHAKSVYIPFNYTIHESNPWITSCSGRVPPVQNLMFAITCSLPWESPWNRLSCWRTSPHWPKNANIHPPQTPDLLCLPLNLVSTRLKQENLKSPNYTSWWGHGFVNLSLQGTSWPSERIWVSKGSFIGSFSTTSLAVPQWWDGEKL